MRLPREGDRSVRIVYLCSSARKDETGEIVLTGELDLNAELEDLRPEDAKSLYDLVLQTSNWFLHNCKHFSIDILREENPSYAVVAARMRQIAKLIYALADDLDPWMCQKAFEYCELMTKMGVAIDKDDHIELQRLVAELQRKPGI